MSRPEDVVPGRPGPDITWSGDARAERSPALSERDDYCGPAQRQGDDDD